MTPTSTTTRRRRIAGERRPTSEHADPRVQPQSVSTREPDESDAADAPSPPSDDTPARASTPKRPVAGWQLAVLAVVAVVAVALAAGPLIPGVGIQAIQQASEHDAVGSASRTAPAAAERAAAAILAYDYKTLEADRDNAARFMTPSYRKEYLQTFGLVLDNAPKVKAVVKADVRASGVAHADPDRVNVLLFVNQTTTSTANDQPQTALNRVMMTMQRTDDGGWLVDDITSY